MTSADPESTYEALQKYGRDLVREARKGKLDPVVGRDEEMETLRRVIDRLRKGRGQIVCLIGEAGLGKSRLIEELRDEWLAVQPAAANDDWDRWAAMGAVSYGAGDPYGMIKHQVRQYCDIQLGDPPDVVQQKLLQTFSDYPDAVRAPIVRTYGWLLGADQDDDLGPPQSGESKDRASPAEKERAQHNDGIQRSRSA